MKEKKIYTLVLVFCLLLNSLITANASFIYTDQDTGTSFTVPEDWYQKDMLTTEVDSLDVKFVPIYGNDSMIAYGSIDFWETLSDFDKAGYSRTDYNNSMFTESDIAEMYNTTTDRLSTVAYNDIDYFRVDMEASIELNGVELTIIPTVLLRFDNGWCYIFYFYRDTEASESKCFADFERLLNSVEYPVANVEQPSSVYDDYTDTEEIEEEDGYSGASKRLTVAVLLVVLFTIIVLIIFYRNKVKEKELQKDIYDIRNNDYSDCKSANLTKQFLTCKNCGGKIPLDSKFCHICGTNIIK